MGAIATTPLDDLLRPSRRAVAKKLVQRLQQNGVETSAGTFSEKNLIKQIGLLAKGDGRWWADEQHEPARAAFMGITPEVARFMPPLRGASDAVWHFVDFPEVPPLRLAEEHPPTLGSPSIEDIEPDERAHWVVMARGSGRTLTVRWLSQHRPDVYSISVDTLADAVAAACSPEALLVIDVDRRHSSDVTASSALMERGNVVVLAPFHPPPGVRCRPHGPDFARTDRSMWAGLVVEREDHEPSWRLHEWTPHEGWRRWFVSWVCRRHPGASLDPREVADALDEVDPEHDWFATPGDVLPTLAAAQRGMLPRDAARAGWARSGLTKRWLETRAAASADPWVRAHGAAVMRRLVHAVVDRIALPLAGDLPNGGVSAMISNGPPSRKQLEQALRDVQAGGEDVGDVAERLVAGDGAAAVERLIESRLLTRESDEIVSVQPSWVPSMLAEASIRSRLTDLPSASWGRWCIERTRQGVVDACLDDLSLDRLRKLVRRVIGEHDSADLGSVAAVEAVFAALGRRMQDLRKSPMQTQTLRRVWAAQWEHLGPRYNESIPAPLTRFAPPEGDDVGLEWIANCWAWSLWCPPPPRLTFEGQVGMAWLLPGWISPSWSVAPSWIVQISTGGKPDDRESWGKTFGRLLALAPEVASRAVGPVEEPPALFHPHLLTTGSAGNATGRISMSGLSQASWVTTEVLHWCKSAEFDSKRRVAETLLAGLAAEKGVIEALGMIAVATPDLHAALDETSVEDQLRAEPRLHECPAALVAALPAERRTEALLKLIAGSRELAAAMLALLPDKLDVPLELPVYASLIVRGAMGSSSAAARAAWRHVGSDEVLSTLIDEIRSGSEVARHLWLEAPADVHQELVERMCEGSVAIPDVDWFERGLRRAVFTAPRIAERAYELLQSRPMGGESVPE